MHLLETLKILSELIKFETVSGTSNIDLIEYCEKKLGATRRRILLKLTMTKILELIYFLQLVEKKN